MGEFKVKLIPTNGTKMLGVAMLEAQDLQELLDSAKDKDEEQASRLFFSSLDALIAMARNLFSDTEEKIAKGLEYYSQDPDAHTHIVSFDDALETLQGSSGTKETLSRVLEKHSGRITTVMNDLGMDAEEAVEDVMLTINLLERLDGLDPGNSQNKSIEKSSEKTPISKSALSWSTRRILLGLAFGVALREEPESKRSIAIYRRVAADMQHDLWSKYADLGFGDDFAELDYDGFIEKHLSRMDDLKVRELNGEELSGLEAAELSCLRWEMNRLIDHPALVFPEHLRDEIDEVHREMKREEGWELPKWL